MSMLNRKNYHSINMTNAEINKFKSEIGKYNFLISSSKLLLDKIDVQLYNMTGVKGVAFDRIRGNASEHQIAMIKHEQSEVYEKLLKAYEKKAKRIAYVDSILEKMDEDDRELFVLKYIDGLSFERLAKMNYISKTGMIYRMNNILKEL